MPHLKDCHWVVAYNFSIHVVEQHSLLLCWWIDFIMGILLMDNKTKFDFVISGFVNFLWVYMNFFHNLHLFHWEIINCFSENSADWVITTITEVISLFAFRYIFLVFSFFCFQAGMIVVYLTEGVTLDLQLWDAHTPDEYKLSFNIIKMFCLFAGRPEPVRLFVCASYCVLWMCEKINCLVTLFSPYPGTVAHNTWTFRGMSQRICRIEHPQGRYSFDSSLSFPMCTK